MDMEMQIMEHKLPPWEEMGHKDEPSHSVSNTGENSKTSLESCLGFELGNSLDRQEKLQALDFSAGRLHD